MKTSKYIVAILLVSLGITTQVLAQDTIRHRSVSVEREYRPVIHDAGKINSIPQVLEPTGVKSPAEFSDFNLPLNAAYNVRPLPAAELVGEKHTNANPGYARLGFGNYLNTLADFAYPIISSTDTRLDFSLNHLATFDPTQMHTTTKANLSFDMIINTFDLYAAVGGGHEYLRYYGNYFNGSDSALNINTLIPKYGQSIYVEKDRAGVINTPLMYSLNSLATDPIGDTFWRFNMLAGVRSLPQATDLRYQAELQYRVFNSANGIKEKVVHTVAGFSSPSQDNRLGIGFELYNMAYSSTKIPDFNFWKSYSVLALNPYYSIERPEYKVRLGLKSSFSFVHGKFYNPSADISAEWKAVPEYMTVYGGLTGDYQVNTLDKIDAENPYVYSDLRVKDTNAPVELYAGIKLKPVYNLLLDAYLDYKQFDNQYFFVNKGYSLITSPAGMPQSDTTLYSNRFNVVYSNASRVKLGFRADYNLHKRINVEFKWAYNSWNVDTQDHAWNMPEYESQFNTNVRVTDNFSVSANVYYEGGRFAKLGEVAVPMHDKVDINLGAAYSYLNWLTVFGKINNLISNKYQNYYGYDVQGANVMVGAAFNF